MESLGKYCLKIGSGATPSGGKEAYQGGNFYLIRSQNVLDFSFSEEGLAKINDAQAAKLKNVELQEGDVLLNITGDSVARVCLLPIDFLPARVNQHVAIVRANPYEMDNHYLLYYLQSIKPNLLTMASGGATRNALTKQMLENLPISLPPLPIQKKIAAILSSLDDKIENNRRINKNLEEQAQALFKSWFVDFEPFREGEFVDSELGMIPKGWKLGCLNELLSKIGTGLNPRKNFVLGQGDNYYVTIKNLGDNDLYLDDKCDKVDNEALVKINNRSHLQKGDILFSGIGTIGRTYLIDEEPSNWNTSESLFNMRPIEGLSSEFLYLLLLSDWFQGYVKVHAQGAVQQGIRMGDIKACPLAIAPKDVYKHFTQLAAPLVQQTKLNQKESRRLAQLRDTLLPKLMNGEIEL